MKTYRFTAFEQLPHGSEIWKVDKHAPGPWDPELVETFTGPGGQAQAKAKADELNAAELNRVMGETVTRYKTNWYVTIDPSQVDRLAEIDKTPADKIEKTPGVKLLHNHGSFSYWSDGRLTKKCSYIPNGGELTRAAAGLLSTVIGADGGYVEGGLTSLVDIKTVLSEESIEVGPNRGVYAREKIEKLTVELLEGSQRVYYVHTAGYFEGYQYDLYLSLDSLKAKMFPAPGPEGVTVFPPDDFDYDSDLGYMDKGQNDDNLNT